jgi:outer membrane receptor protein involved in Fe transport
LLDTATSTAVLSQRDLERRAGLITSKDVLEHTPNISIVGTGNQAPTIRGVDGTGAAKGSDAFFAGSRPRFNVQIDGRPASYNEITFGDTALWDVRQVEVLRGAQSTLQGRNAIAGTMLIKTNDPTYETEAAVRVGGGNYEQQRYSAMVSAPLVADSVAFRLTGDYLEKHTFVRGFESFPGVADPGEFSALNVRGKLLIEPASIAGLRALITLNHSDYTGPQTENVDRPFARYRSGFSFQPVFEPENTSLIGDVQYDIDPRFSVSLLASGSDLSVARKSPPGNGIADIDGREYVFEPRLNYRGGGRTSAVVGAYLFRADNDESIDFPSPQQFADEVRTAALFGEATLQLTDALDLIGGARFEDESHARQGGDQTSVVIDLDESYSAFLPKAGLAWHLGNKATLGFTIARGFNGGGAGFTFDETTEVFTNYQYDPEYVWTYEIFGRQELANGVGLTANVFYSRYRDMQLSYDLTPADPTDFSFVVRNAEATESYGAELGVDWQAAEGLGVYASVGLLNAQITKYPDSGFQGNDQPFAPDFSASAGVTWSRNGWDAGLSTRYSSSYYSDLENNPRGKVDAYWVANAQLAYTWKGVRVYGYVDNLFDSTDLLTVYSGPTPETDTADILPPRTYFAGVQYSF